MAEKSVVIEGHFGIEGDELAFARENAGIDFEKRGVGIDESAVERLKKRRGVIDDFERQVETESDLARLIGLKTDGWMNRFAQNGAGIVLGDFFNFHAAGGTGHEDDLAGGAIDEQTQIEFALDIEPFFDEKPFHDAAGRSSLRSDQLHAENVAGDVRGFVRRAR